MIEHQFENFLRWCHHFDFAPREEEKNNKCMLKVKVISYDLEKINPIQ
jgi:hypothetical protein